MSRLGRSSWRSSYATSTVPKMKPNEAHIHHPDTKSRSTKMEHMPVYVSIGMISLCVAFGVHTMMQQARAPNVSVKKSSRGTVREVEEPEAVHKDSERFLSKSWFRQLARVQDFDRQEVMPDPIRVDDYPVSDRGNARAPTLKDVGVDPKT